MTTFFMSRPTPQVSRDAVAEEAVVARVAKKAGVDEAVVRTFAKISAPGNKATFSARSAAKAFAHVKVD
ncbi:MAG: hypothetical protein ACT6RO_19505 [Hydrogenophaga sp.]|uniref:hypothetical protein n=1 Tax=Hydrogenophaga sp. TaxID=1904254 RepID=UPI004036053D